MFVVTFISSVNCAYQISLSNYLYTRISSSVDNEVDVYAWEIIGATSSLLALIYLGPELIIFDSLSYLLNLKAFCCLKFGCWP